MTKQDLRTVFRKQWNQCINLVELQHIALRHKSAPAVERWILIKGEKERNKFEQLKRSVS